MILRQAHYLFFVGLLRPLPDALAFPAAQGQQAWQQQTRVFITGFTSYQGRKMINGDDSQFWSIEVL